jgi:hypothetical protein
MSAKTFRVKSKAIYEHLSECVEYRTVPQDWTRSEAVYTVSTLKDQGEPVFMRERLVIYAGRLPGTIASSRPACKQSSTNHQLKFGRDCFIYSLTQTQSRFTDKGICWDLHSVHQRFHRLHEVRLLDRSCSDHRDYYQTYHVSLVWQRGSSRSITILHVLHPGSPIPQPKLVSRATSPLCCSHRAMDRGKGRTCSTRPSRRTSHPHVYSSD